MTAEDSNLDLTKPIIALTFDDGPSEHTGKILDLLESHGARATFCVVGNLAETGRDTIIRATELGCEIIGHSWDHSNLSKLSDAEITQQLNDTASVIGSITGMYPLMYRPPYGETSETLLNVSARLGYALINWSADTKDWSGYEADKVYDALIQGAKDRAVILCHDSYASTADAMERAIPELISEGYQLVTVSELMHCSNIVPQAGRLYYECR